MLKAYLDNWIITCKKINLYLNLTPITKHNSKWIKYLSLTDKTIQVLAENIGVNLSDLELGSSYSALRTKA